MPAVTGVTVSGFRELQTSTATASREVRRYASSQLREVAAPIQHSAEALTVGRIPRTQRSPLWAQYRIGVLRSAVYVAPRQRGVRGRTNPRRREKFADLLMERAMEPALDQNVAHVETAIEKAIDRITDRFNAGG